MTNDESRGNSSFAIRHSSFKIAIGARARTVARTMKALQDATTRMWASGLTVAAQAAVAIFAAKAGKDAGLALLAGKAAMDFIGGMANRSLAAGLRGGAASGAHTSPSRGFPC